MKKHGAGRCRLQRLVDRVALELLSVAVRCGGIGVLTRYLRSPNPRLTVRLLRRFGAVVGEGTTIKGALLMDNVSGDEHSTGDFSHLKIGRNCYIGEGVCFDLAHAVTIEDDVVVSALVAFLTHADCNRSAYLAERYPRRCAPIRIERGAWLCFRATILPGVTVGREAVLAAHAVLRGNAAGRTFHAGVPARLVKSLAPGATPEELARE